MRGRALILVEPDASAMRVSQIVTIYKDLKLAIDYLLIGDCTLPLSVGGDCDARIAVIPAAQAAAEPAAQTFLAAFMADRDYRIVHALGPNGQSVLRWCGQALRVAEWTSVKGLMGGEAELVLTYCRDTKDNSEPSSNNHLVLPPAPPHIRIPELTPQPFLGWVGRWDDTLVGSWQEFLAALVQSVVAPDIAILLAGPGVDAVVVPRELGGVLRIPDPVRMAGARRALGLAVLPVGEVHGHPEDTALALAHGTLVLMLKQAAEYYGEDWRLPASDDLDGLADLVAGLAPRLGDIGLPRDLLYAAVASERALRALLDQATAAFLAELHNRAGLVGANP